MAGQISHALAGEASLAAALKSAGLGPDSLSEAAAAFRLGCQGPDIFYHNQRTKPSGLHYGSLAHRRRFGSLVAGAAAALPPPERRPGSEAGAYLLGLATHAAVDRATHPFIVCLAGWPDPADPGSERRRGCHAFLERLLDERYLRSLLGLSPREFRLSELMGIGEEARAARPGDEAIAALWSAGLRAAYPRATAADALLDRRIANALSDARGFYRATDPAFDAGRERAEEWLERLSPEEGRRLMGIVYPVLPHEGLDAMNESGAEWPHPAGDGRSSRASYPELMEEGIAQASRAISLVLASWGIPATRAPVEDGEAAGIAAALGEGGLAICDRGGLAVAPRVCRPLPLPEAMEAEYAARAARMRLSR